MTPTIKTTFSHIVVFMGDVPHLVLPREELLGFQTWREPEQYVIEWTLRGGAMIVSQYNTLEKMSAVACGVAQILADYKPAHSS